MGRPALLRQHTHLKLLHSTTQHHTEWLALDMEDLIRADVVARKFLIFCTRKPSVCSLRRTRIRMDILI